MARIKCSMLINITTGLSNPMGKHRTGGVSETVYSASADPAVVQASFETLCRMRSYLLPTGATIVGQRYQQIDPLGPAQTTGSQFPGLSLLGCDHPNMTLQCRGKGLGVRNTRNVWIRCLPDLLAKDGELDTSQSAWISNLIRFFSSMGLWYFKGRDLSQPSVPIIAAGPDVVAGNGIVNTEIAHGLNIGDMVRLMKMKGPDGRFKSMRGKVKSTPALDQFTVSNWKFGTDTFTGGKSRKDLTIYPQFAPTTALSLFGQTALADAGINPQNVTTKKVGRPFGEFRGHASAKR